jgi:two-component system sensor histidine kinase ChvG
MRDKLPFFESVNPRTREPMPARRSKREMSPLTARILAVNAMPLVLLVGSIFYLGGFQDRLIQNELESMLKEARQFAVAIGEGAAISSDEDRDLLSPELAEGMVMRFVETTDTRLRLYDIRGSLFTDTTAMPGFARIESEPLMPPGEDAESGISGIWNRFLSWRRQRSWSKDYTLYKENREPSSQDYQLVESALDGDEGGQVWILPSGHILLGVAVPVQRYKSVLGALFLTRPGAKVEEAVRGVHMDILRLFLFTMVVTVTVSLYLARTIAKPLQQLAHAADDLKIGQTGALTWQSTLPDFSGRHDEIGDLSLALKTMMKALGERMHAIESFAADVAHEIKNPLTSLHSAVETAQKISDPEKQKRLMAVIAHDVQRLDRLISDISQASRVEAELVRAQTQRIALSDMLKLVTELYTRPLEGDLLDTEKPAVLLDIKAPDLLVEGVEGRLIQVFQNLISNALSFSPEGEAVRVTLDRREDRAFITVTDKGPGIPESKLQTVFDRFYSERPEGESFGEHSGLGLSIARQIVDAHQGRIWADNMKDGNGKVGGARFTVEIPLAKIAPPGKAPANKKAA